MLTHTRERLKVDGGPAAIRIAEKWLSWARAVTVRLMARARAM